MDRLGVPATARGSLTLYNNQDDIDPLSAALQTGPTVRMTSDRPTALSGRDRRPKAPELLYAEACRKAEGLNPILRRSLMLYVQVDNGDVRDVSFEGAEQPRRRRS